MVANDRAQLVLVGAVVIAFIVIGIVVVFNGVVFTESVGDQGTVIDTKESGSVGFGAERNLGEAAHTANTEGKFDDATSVPLADYIDDTGSPLATAEAESGGNLVDVEYEDYLEEGVRLYQPETGNFTSGGGDPDWDPINSGTEFDRFVISIDVQESEPGTLTVTNGTGGDLEISVTNNVVELTGAVRDENECSGIEPAGGADDDFVTIQFNRGFVLDQPDCRIEPAYLDGVENNGFSYDSDPDNIKGMWDIVIEDEGAFDDDDYDSSSSEISDEPNESTIIWSAEYTITYDAGQVETVAEEREVDHYG